MNPEEREVLQNVTLRQATENDFNGLLNIKNDFGEEDGMYVVGRDPDFLIQDINQGSVGIIECNGEFAGTITCVVMSDDAGKYVYISDFVILPKFQDKGIGTYIMNEVINGSDGAGAAIVAVEQGNTRAVKFYKENGFIAGGEEGSVANVEGRATPVIIMAKTIRRK